MLGDGEILRLQLKDIPKLRVLAVRQIILIGMLETLEGTCLIALLVDHATPITVHQCNQTCHNRGHKGDDEPRLVSRSVLRLENEGTNEIAQAISDIDT
jgi:hypothetical protein